MPFLSIIIPVYKVESYLRECLDSVAASTLDCWEAILIDDGSPDGCPQICDEYALKDSRFKVIHQENAGVAAARNAGLDVAHGEWVWFVDSDDVVDMQPVGDMVTWLKGHQEVDLTMFDLDTFKDGKSVTMHDFLSSFSNEQLTRNEFLNKYISFFHQQFWFRRSEQFRFTKGIRVSEDLEFMYRYYTLCQQPVKFQSTLYHYRVRETSVTQDENYRKKAVEDLPVVLNNLVKWIHRYEVKPEPWLDFRVMKLMQNLLYSASQVKTLDVESFQHQVSDIMDEYYQLGFNFVSRLKNRLAKRNVKLFFLFNKIYLKLRCRK